METPAAVGEPEVRELPIVSGHLALNFANTIDNPGGPTRHDHIGTYPELLQWSLRLGVLSSAQVDRLRTAIGKQDAAAAVLRAHDLRRTLVATFTAIATGESTIDRNWTDLQPFVIEAVANAELVPVGGTHEWNWPDNARPHAMLWPIAHAAADLVTAPELDRLKRCAGCPWLFLDQSKNASRRWCAMNDCGTNAKMRRYVARRAASRTSTR
ncbi:CGNR zinc finger domain-containing protein [Kribbella sp. NPDC051586]|uniref:CGNR zinc finger domain-containing protein n=1 Tax=Kribbella sp. NPDC051586 TaxID=3364118 RepID=UPI00378EA1D4